MHNSRRVNSRQKHPKVYRLSSINLILHYYYFTHDYFCVTVDFYNSNRQGCTAVNHIHTSRRNILLLEISSQTFKETATTYTLKSNYQDSRQHW